MSHVTINGAVQCNLQSVYAFANSMGMRPQQLYGAIRNGSFPSEYIQNIKLPDGKVQPMVKIREATEFFATKYEERHSKAVQQIIEHPELVAEAFIAMVEADNAKLGKSLRSWWEKKNQ